MRSPGRKKDGWKTFSPDVPFTLLYVPDTYDRAAIVAAFLPYYGVELRSREFADLSLPQQNYSTFTPGIVGGLKVRIWKNLSLVARARVHYLLYNVDETRSLGSADFGALLDYEFKD